MITKRKLMKKYLLSVALICIFGVYALYKVDVKTQAAAAAAAADVIIPDKSQVAFVVVSTTQAGQYRDGRYIGNRADAYYGNVQVAVDISGGKIAKVQVFEYPKTQQNSIRLNEVAIPRLASEAIAVQNTNVDAVTGASLTSAAFLESLSTALSQASSNKLQ